MGFSVALQVSRHLGFSVRSIQLSSAATHEHVHSFLRPETEPVYLALAGRIHPLPHQESP